MSFTNFNLNPNIAKAIHLCGYTEPTPIQTLCIPDILKRKDMIASAQTGTGKTAAFVLPALHQLSISKSSNKVRVLVLTPTRELANQITDATNKYGKFLQLNIVSLVGGTSYRQQFKKLSRRVDMIIATPGRLLDHMKNHALDLSSVEILILDEADRMLDMGFVDDVSEIASHLPVKRQTLLFSATVDHKITHILKNLLKDPILIDLSLEKLTPTHITQELYIADDIQHKNRLLHHILNNKNIFKGIIFTATKANADKLSKELSQLGHLTSPLHGDLKQNVRNRTIEQLRRGKIQYLVATDVAARGIDINDITHVINFDLPRLPEDYVHRIGRTGRAGKSGIAISFASRHDIRMVEKIERFTHQILQREIIVGLEPSSKSGMAKNKKNKQFNVKHKSRFKTKPQQVGMPKKKVSAPLQKAKNNHFKFKKKSKAA